MDLPTTTGDSPTFSDPYRLYNLDVFEYHASSPMSLYGSIPLMHAHSTDSTVAVLNLIASETWVDAAHPTEKSTETHWFSESGILDVLLLPGPGPSDIFALYAKLTGTPPMPPHWALGYHQCRWNYVSSDDVRTVQKRFDEDDIPVDVFWLDIEYAEDHKYFIWNEKTFPDPIDMVNDVAALRRKVDLLPSRHCSPLITPFLFPLDGYYHRPPFEASVELPCLPEGFRARCVCQTQGWRRRIRRLVLARE